eukprot:6486015-Amphidinium_carterae.1
MDLGSVMMGKKLGVHKRFANDLIPKVKDEQERIILQNHLTLYDACEKLAPAEIESIPEAKLRENIELVKASGLTCPPHVHRHLWKLRKADAVSALFTASGAGAQNQLHSLWHMVTPYQSSHAEQGLGLDILAQADIADDKDTHIKTFVTTILMD